MSAATVTLPEALALATQHHRAGAHEAAAATYRKILNHYPQEHNALHLLGLLERQKGHVEQAIALIRRALSVEPAFADAHINLGNALQAAGRSAEAIEAYRHGLALNPMAADPCNTLGTILYGLGRREEAVAAFRQAHTADAGLMSAHVNLSVSLSEIVPAWHLPMMNDAARNAAYEAALKRAIRPGDHVLEIGTGSGLLAMMAARAGAARVTTCEMVPLIAETARRIIADNGYADRVTVIAAKSDTVVMGRDLPRPADVLVSEVLANDFLSEGVLPSLEDAKARLIAPDARIIPAAGGLRIALAGGRYIADNLYVDHVAGFDLRAFNAITPRKKATMLYDQPFTLFSEPVEAFRFDFTASGVNYLAEEKELTLPITADGTCYGVLQWIWLDTDAEDRFENHPTQSCPASGWQHVLFQFPAPVEVRIGTRLRIAAHHDRLRPWFRLLS